jgi:hypothetical protein
MKMKFSLGEGGIKGFFARHIEKIIFGLAVLVVIWVALPDSKRKPIDENVLGPEAIKRTASSASQRLASETAWPLIKSERFKAPDDYLARAERSLIRIERDGYPAEIPLNKPLFPRDPIRVDPRIYPPQEPEVAVSYGPVTLAADTKNVRPTIRRGEVATEDGRPLPPEVQQRLAKFGAPVGGAKAEGKYIVAVKFLVPIKQQIAEFRSAFKDAADYNEARDFPNYGAGRETEYGKYYYRVERAEIAPDGTEGKWAMVGDSYRARKAEATWPQVTELADSKYVDPVWTMSLPPLVMRDLRPLALHSKVPSAAQAAEDEAEPEEGETEDPMEDLDGPVIGGGDDDPRTGPVPPRGTPRPPITRPRGPRSGEGGFAMGGGVDMNDDVDYKLFRFFDMDVQPGKSYVYRVKLYIEDPNDPSPSHQKPPSRVLDKSVLERLARKTDKNVWWRESDYSEVTPVVRVPATKQVLAGSVLPEGTIVKADANDRVGTRISEAMVNVMALVWDERKAMDVPGTTLAGRGSVLNFTSDVEAIDVAAGVLKKLDKYQFETDSIVLDLRGGESFGRRSDKNELSSPGEMLLIDAKGNLVVRKELEDATAYAENTFPEEPKTTTTEGPLVEEDKKKPRTGRPRSGEGEVNLLEGSSSPPRRRER